MVLLCVCLVLLFSMGCATAAKNFAEGWRQGPSRAAAEAHQGSAFTPLYGRGGAYTGYTQQVGEYIYIHRPDGGIVGAYKSRPPLAWVEHYDARGRLVEKSLSRYASTDPKDLSLAPVSTIRYHYSADDELLGSTTLIHKEHYDMAVHNDALGRALPAYAPLPWAATSSR